MPLGWAARAVLAVGLGALMAGGVGAALVLRSVGAALGPLALGLIIVLVAGRRDVWWPALRDQGLRCGEEVDRGFGTASGPWIALAAGTALALELFLIRWHASSFQLFSYFKNVSLLASFLGLGIGYALGRGRALLLGLALPAVSLQVLVLQALGQTPIQGQLQSPISENLALGLVDGPILGHWLLTYGVLVAVFLATVLTAIPFGHLAGRLMEGVAPVAAYGWNLAGSLGAVLIFVLLAEAWSPPSVWLLVVIGGVLPFLSRSVSVHASVLGLASVGLALVVLALPGRTDAVTLFSPYQVLTLRLNPVAPFLEVNHAYFQQIWNLRAGVPRDAEHAGAARHYDLPYTFRARPERVLVVGSGTGNDVAAGVRNGAGAIDAVEIDPAIVALGRALHPERPYQQPQVHVHVEDARAFIRHTQERYDLIVYGLLDSHTVLSGSSSVRLDSYVYTVEAFREARARLREGGVLVMAFTLVSREIGWKLFLMLREAFGEDPRAFETFYDGGLTFVIGPGLSHLATPLGFPEVTDNMRKAGLQADVSTDDWPFLYMSVRRYPLSYLVMAAVLSAASVLVLLAFLPVQRRSFSGVSFALGAGFMLLETKAITELALVFGSTWQVTSVVIVGVLVMAMLANLWVEHIGPPPTVLLYALLAASIVAGLVLPVRAFGLPAGAERVAATALATLPLLFSGGAFSAELLRRGQASTLLSWNLMGAMVGGLLEYNSLFLGISRLGIVALVLYGAAFVWTRREHPRVALQPE